jgi:hypothetical protein
VRWRVQLLAICLPALAAGPVAQAQQPAPSADRLFQEGVKLFQQGATRTACERFAASYALDHASGTLFNLAGCHEKDGKLWLAHEELVELVRRAIAAGKPEKAAQLRARVSDLEARLPKIRLVSSGSSNVASIAVDGREVDASLWAVPLPVDAGTHAIVFSAPGKVSATATATVIEPSDVASVNVPTLAEAAPAASPPIAPGPAVPAPAAVPPTALAPSPAQEALLTASGESGRRTACYVMGGAGIVALGVGAFFGFQTFSQKSDASSACGASGTTCLDAAHASAAQSKLNDARTSATISTVGVGVGATAVAVAGYLLFFGSGSATPARSPQAAVLLAPMATPNGGGVSVEGAF